MTANARASGRLLVTSARVLDTGTDGERPDRAAVSAMPTTPKISISLRPGRRLSPPATHGCDPRVSHCARAIGPVGAGTFSRFKGRHCPMSETKDQTADEPTTTASPAPTVVIGWAEIGGSAPVIGAATLGGSAPVIGSFSMLQPAVKP